MHCCFTDLMGKHAEKDNVYRRYVTASLSSANWESSENLEINANWKLVEKHLVEKTPSRENTWQRKNLEKKKTWQGKYLVDKTPGRENNRNIQCDIGNTDFPV